MPTRDRGFAGHSRSITETTSSEPWLLGRVLVGVPVCAVLAYGTVSFIARAWDACDDAEPPYLFGLMLFTLPMIGLAQWSGWTGVALVCRKRSWRVFLATAVGAALILGWAAAAMEVPAHDESFYAADAADPTADGYLSPMYCRPDGVPAWWPSWLPL